MYNINLASPQSFEASANNDLYFKSWSSNVKEPIKVFYIIGSAIPNSIPFNVAIENHFATEPLGKYSSFYARALVTDFTGDDDNFEVAAGDMTTQPNGLLLTPNNLNQIASLSFHNLSLTGPGKYKAYVYFYVDGVRVDSGFKDLRLSTFRVDVELVVLAQNSVSANVDKMVLSHIKTELPLPAQQFEILSSVDYHIFVPEYFDLSGGNLVQLENTANSKNKYFGNGRQIVNIALNADFDFYESDVFIGHIGIQLIEDFFSPKWQTELVAYLLDAHEISSDKESLQFFSIKDVRDGSSQELEIVSSQDYTVTTPFFMQVSPLSGSSFKTHKLKPIAARNLVAGDYEGVILFQSVDASLEVPVNLKVVESIDPAFKLDSLNFCGNNKENSMMYSNKSYERAALSLDLMFYDYKNFGTSLERSYRHTFFNSGVSVNVGDLVSDFFADLRAPSTIGFNIKDTAVIDFNRFQVYPYYKPTKIDLVLNIERRDTGAISKTKSFNNLEFVSGRKPKRFSNTIGILDVNDIPIRVTRKSQLLFNFYRKVNDHDIKIYKNAVLFKTVTHSPGNNSLFGLAMFFYDFNPGDVIDVALEKNEIESFVKQYLVFPDQSFSNHIGYLDEHNLLQTFEFTGEMQITTDYEFITASSFQDFVDKLKNLDSKKEQRLIINTGWILKSNSVIIDSIIRSTSSWLLGKEEEVSLTSVTSKLVNSDTEQELYAYDLEFIINRESDAKVY